LNKKAFTKPVSSGVGTGKYCPKLVSTGWNRLDRFYPVITDLNRLKLLKKGLSWTNRHGINGFEPV
jgi:hypothetical protein